MADNFKAAHPIERVNFRSGTMCQRQTRITKRHNVHELLLAMICIRLEKAFDSVSMQAILLRP